MLPYLTIEKMKEVPRLWLCKPDLNRTPIARLSDIYNFNLNTKENNLSEITFDIPLQIERNHELIDNPILEKFKGLYYVKMIKDKKVEYFVSSRHSGAMSNNGESKSFQLFGLGHQLDNKTIREYEGVSQNLSKYAMDFLQETNWTLGSVDVDFDLKYRSFDISTATVLQSLYDIAELFGAYIEWDTVNRRVSFYDPNKVGLNRGLKFKEGHYLESFNIDFDYDEIITRLKVYGEDGLEFRRLSPTGSNYIEDFSWFMYGFDYSVDMEGNYTVNQSSDYMSDDLCIALVKYNKLLDEKNGEFENLTTQRTNKEDAITQKKQELSVINTELNTLYNELDVINATYGDSATSRTDYQTCKANIDAKKSEYTTKESEISTLESELATIDTDIQNLRITLQTENNFTTEQLMELNDFIIEGEHSNNSIVDEQDLLDEGLRVFKENSTPKISLSMNIANFLNLLEDDPKRKTLILGDTVRFESKKLKIEVTARLSEINYDYENGNISIVVTNVRDSRNDDEKIFDLINGSARTSTAVNMDKFKVKQSITQSDDVTKLLNNTFDATLHGIKGGVNDSITLNERGLYSTSVQDPNAMLVIQGGILAISGDSLNSVNVAINKDGVFADKLVGRAILSNKLHVEDDLGIVKIESGTQTIFDADGIKKIELGKYTDPNNSTLSKYGLRIYDGAIDIRTSGTSNKGVQFDVNGIRSFNSNGVQTFDVNSSTGKITSIADFEFKTSPTSYRGVIFDNNGISGYDSFGVRQFHLDAITGSITAKSGTFSGTIEGGSITSNTTIDVTTDLYVGNNIYLGDFDSTGFKEIRFNSQNVIHDDGTTLTLSAQYLWLETVTLDLTNVLSVNWGSHRPIAVFG